MGKTIHEISNVWFSLHNEGTVFLTRISQGRCITSLCFLEELMFFKISQSSILTVTDSLS